MHWLSRGQSNREIATTMGIDEATVKAHLGRMLRKVDSQAGPFLVVAKDLTVEARQVAIEAGCDVVTQREFGWTDASYRSIRRTSSN